MPAKFNKISDIMCLGVSVGSKYHNPKTFGEEILKALIAQKKNGKEIKKVILVVGGILQRHNHKILLNEAEAYKKSLKQEKDWIKKILPYITELQAAGIECEIAPWCKIILNDPANPEDSNIYLDTLDPQTINSEFKKYEKVDLKDTKNYNKEFLEYKRFITDIYNSDVPIQSLINSAAKVHLSKGVNADTNKPNQSKDEQDQSVDKIKASEDYIIEEVANLFRYDNDKFGLSDFYYPYVNPLNPTAEMVVDIVRSIKDYVIKNKNKVGHDYPTIAFDLFDNRIKINNYTLASEIINNLEPVSQKQNGSADDSYHDDNSYSKMGSIFNGTSNGNKNIKDKKEETELEKANQLSKLLYEEHASDLAEAETPNRRSRSAPAFPDRNSTEWNQIPRGPDRKRVITEDEAKELSERFQKVKNGEQKENSEQQPPLSSNNNKLFKAPPLPPPSDPKQKLSVTLEAGLAAVSAEVLPLALSDDEIKLLMYAAVRGIFSPLKNGNSSNVSSPTFQNSP